MPKQRLLVLLYLVLWITVADFLKVIKQPASVKSLSFYAASGCLLLLMASAAAAPLRVAAAWRLIWGCGKHKNSEQGHASADAEEEQDSELLLRDA